MMITYLLAIRTAARYGWDCMRSSVLFSFLLLLPTLATAAEKTPVFMEADHMAYDNKNNVVVAKGNVEVVRGQRVLIADTIYYYQTQDVVKAKGNVSLLQDDGNVMFADNLTLEPQLKQGVIEQFKARLSDNSAFAAAEAKRVSPSQVELTKAVYSPCKICEDDPESEPLWQIKSDHVTIDAEEEVVEYEGAVFEVKGVPVAYTPYFRHPTPEASRKSGILRPEYGQSDTFGASIKAPYYWNIDPDKDATITPWIFTGEAPALIGEYRQKTDDGMFQFNGSGTIPEKRDNKTGDTVAGNEFRGHIFATGRTALTDDWSAGFDVNRTTDDTYLRRYRFGNFETLTSRAYAETIQDRDYAVVEGLSFQGLKETDDPDTEPFVLPNASVHLETAPLAMNARVRFDADAMALTRQLGTETRRLSTAAAYSIPYVTDGGHVLEAEAGARVDAYNQDNLTLDNGDEYSGTTARAVPHAALKWRYPLMAQVSDASVTVEPIAQVVVSTNGHNRDKIANEDSQTPEFTNDNLFDVNRYAGLDRIEEGTRAMAGVQAQAALSGGDVLSAMVGQEERIAGKNPFPVSDDMGDDFSDVVGQLGYDGRNVQLDYRYRLDEADAELRRSELRGLVNVGRTTIAADYLNINNDPILDDREDVTASLGVRPTDTLGMSVFARRDLLRDAMVIAGAGAMIDYDCVTLSTNLTREFTRDRDFEPDTSITFRVGLKNID
jgi:LPS-assembly protein